METMPAFTRHDLTDEQWAVLEPLLPEGDRPHTAGLLAPVTDFWVFDGQVVLWNNFAGDGSWVGEERSGDPAVAKLCESSFEAAWERGIPHEDYRPA